MHIAISHSLNSALCFALRRLGVFGLAEAALDRPRSYIAKSQGRHRQGGGLQTLTRVQFVSI